MTISAPPKPAPAPAAFARLAQLGAANPKKADEIERRLAALEARAAKDDGEDASDDEDSKDDDDKKTKNKNKAKDKDPKNGDDPKDPDDDTDDGDDTDPKASLTGSFVPYSADKMKADKATAAAIVDAGNRRRGEKA
jgi:hypothetical protein